MNYEVLDRCRLYSCDMSLYDFMKRNFESELIKIVLCVNSLDYYIEVRKVY